MKLIDEPVIQDIEDYNNQESPQKRRNIRLIVLGLVLFSGLMTYIKLTNDTVSDYIGTIENPGIEIKAH